MDKKIFTILHSKIVFLLTYWVLKIRAIMFWVPNPDEIVNVQWVEDDRKVNIG